MFSLETQWGNEGRNEGSFSNSKSKGSSLQKWGRDDTNLAHHQKKWLRNKHKSDKSNSWPALFFQFYLRGAYVNREAHWDQVQIQLQYSYSLQQGNHDEKHYSDKNFRWLQGRLYYMELKRERVAW